MSEAAFLALACEGQIIPWPGEVLEGVGHGAWDAFLSASNDRPPFLVSSALARASRPVIRCMPRMITS
jgi:hypothetical protein